MARLKDKALCCVPYCRKKRGGKHRECWMHVQRRYRENHPIRSLYHDIKSSAKKRGILFTISLPAFKKFVLESGYMHTRGKGALDMAIDRKESCLGYAEGNLQLLPNSVNSSKGNGNRHSARYLEYLRRTGQTTDENGDPF